MKINKIYSMITDEAIYSPSITMTKDLSRHPVQKGYVSRSILFLYTFILLSNKQSNLSFLNTFVQCTSPMYSTNRVDTTSEQIRYDYFGIIVGIFTYGKKNRAALVKSIIFICEKIHITHIFAVMNMMMVALMTAFLLENKPVHTWLDQCLNCFSLLKKRLSARFCNKAQQPRRQTYMAEQSKLAKNAKSTTVSKMAQHKHLFNTDLIDSPTVNAFMNLIDKYKEKNFRNKQYIRDPQKTYSELWDEYRDYRYKSPATNPHEDNHCSAIIAYDLLMQSNRHRPRYFYVTACGMDSHVGMIVGFWNGIRQPIPDMSIKDVPYQENLLVFAQIIANRHH